MTTTTAAAPQIGNPLRRQAGAYVVVVTAYPTHYLVQVEDGSGYIYSPLTRAWDTWAQADASAANAIRAFEAGYRVMPADDGGYDLAPPVHHASLLTLAA